MQFWMRETNVVQFWCGRQHDAACSAQPLRATQLILRNPSNEFVIAISRTQNSVLFQESTAALP